MKNYYEVLGVKPSATSDDIAKKFREIAKKLHPDYNKDINAQEQFINAYEAYSILHNGEKRNAYDKIRNSDNIDIFNFSKEEREKGKMYSEESYSRAIKEIFKEIGIFIIGLPIIIAWSTIKELGEVLLRILFLVPIIPTIFLLGNVSNLFLYIHVVVVVISYLYFGYISISQNIDDYYKNKESPILKRKKTKYIVITTFIIYYVIVYFKYAHY